MKNPHFEFETKEATTQALIFSRNHLLGYHLAQKLNLGGLATTLSHILPSKVLYTTTQVAFNQLDYQPSSKIPNAEYYILIYPSLTDLGLFEQLKVQTRLNSAKLLLVFNYRDADALKSFSKHLTPDLDYRIAILTDPYGPYFLPSPGDRIGQTVFDALTKQSVNLPSQNRQDLYPTYVSDLTPALLKVLFTSGNQGQTFWLSTLESVKLLDFAYQLNAQISEATGRTPELEFTSSTPDESKVDINAIASAQGSINFNPQTTLEEGLRLTLQVPPPWSEVKFEEPKPVPEPIKIKPPVNLAKLPPLERKIYRFFNLKAWKIITIIAAAFIVVFLPIILFAFNSYQGSLRLAKAYEYLEQGSPQQAKVSAQKAGKNFSTARILFQTGSKLLFFIPQDKLTKYDHLLDAGSRLGAVAVTSSEAVTKAQDLYYLILGKQPGDFDAEVLSLQTLLESLYGELSLVKVSLDNTEVNTRLSFLQNLDTAKNKLPETLSEIQFGLSTLQLLPQLINQPTPQTYLVILQNNSELRPTGGFLNSFALLTFDKGRLTEIKTTDVYSSDAQLGGHVEPPSQLKKYLGEEHWYLRDSNWQTDFPTAAQEIRWFVEKETSRSTSGVIALNLFSLQELLQATGPIPLTSYQETISASNLLERAQFYSEANFSELVDQKRHDFLTSVFDSTLTTLKSGQVSLTLLVKALNQSLRQNQMLVAVGDSTVSSTLEDLNFTGSLKSIPCPTVFSTTPCTSETFAIFEANLGVNKTNYFLDRQLNHQVSFDDSGSLNHHIEINYQNHSPSTAWPGGSYKTFTRFYAPQNTQLISLYLNDQPHDIETTSIVSGLQEFGFYHEVGVGESVSLKIDLRSSQILNTKSPTSALGISWQKQSGTKADPLNLTINYPSTILPSQITIPAESQSQKLIFNTGFKSDVTLGVLFRRL